MRAFFLAVALVVFTVGCGQGPAPNPPRASVRPAPSPSVVAAVPAPQAKATAKPPATHNVQQSTHTIVKTDERKTTSSQASASVSVSVHDDSTQAVTKDSHTASTHASSHVSVTVHDSGTEHAEQHVSNSSATVDVESGAMPSPRSDAAQEASLRSQLHRLEQLASP
jgi:hypothetical protein